MTIIIFTYDIKIKRHCYTIGIVTSTLRLSVSYIEQPDMFGHYADLFSSKTRTSQYIFACVASFLGQISCKVEVE